MNTIWPQLFELLGDPAHWGFEVITDAVWTLAGALFVAPLIRRHNRKHSGCSDNWQAAWDAVQEQTAELAEMLSVPGKSGDYFDTLQDYVRWRDGKGEAA